MSKRPTFAGFSLVEVLLAVGIFAFAVPTTLALLSTLGRQGAMGSELLVAQRLSDSIQLELDRLARSDFDGFATAVPMMVPTAAPGLALVATRDGHRLHARDYPPPDAVIATAQQYFLIECWRFAEEPLCFDPAKAYLALAVRVTWPYQLPNGTTAAGEARTAVTFTVVLNR